MNFTLKDFPSSALSRAKIQGIANTRRQGATAGPFTLELPWPPSVNACWKRGKGKRLYCTPEYEAFKQTAAAVALASGARPFAGLVDVTLHCHFPTAHAGHRSDSDSRLKATLDCMNGILWEDDEQVRDVTLVRFDDAESPRVVVAVTPGVKRRTPATAGSEGK